MSDRINHDLQQQYKDSANLNARAALHRDFSTNKTGWFNWLFDLYAIPDHARILELGCGPALFWQANLTRVPDHWEVTLTDFSDGMLADAQRNLGDSAGRFSFRQVNAQHIPFEDDSFDVVVANHMLYHVPNRQQAYVEITRVLKLGGLFYAATNGPRHLMELGDILLEAFPEQQEDVLLLYNPHRLDFRLDNGADELTAWFTTVERHDYEDSLHVTAIEPVVDYLLSMPPRNVDMTEARTQLRAVVEKRMAQSGALDIQKHTGTFICRK